LVRRRLSDFLELGLKIGVVRTRQEPEPSETFLWYRKLDYINIASYPDGRVILARALEGLTQVL
jgi:hypothetical protein